MFALFPSRMVALEVFGYSVRWYGVLYIAAFIAAWLLLPRLQKFRQLQLTDDDWLLVLTASLIGVLVGGRLGYVLLYEPAYFLQHPLEIPAIWHGGMASHGGFIGVAVAVWHASRKLRTNVWSLLDVVTVPIAIGLALGRLGNFINEELYGTVTAVPWGMAFAGAEGLRHPTQLYALGKDVLIAAVCYLHLRMQQHAQPGRTTAYFLMTYAVVRYVVEFFRVQEYPLLLGGSLTLTRGQLYTLPLFVLGIWLWYRTYQRRLVPP